MPILISPKTAADEGEFRVSRSPVTLSCDTLSGGETVTIEYKGDSSAEFRAVDDIEGNDLTLNSARHQIEFTAPGIYNAVKSSTGGAVGVYISSADF